VFCQSASSWVNADAVTWFDSSITHQKLRDWQMRLCTRLLSETKKDGKDREAECSRPDVFPFLHAAVARRVDRHLGQLYMVP